MSAPRRKRLVIRLSDDELAALIAAARAAKEGEQIRLSSAGDDVALAAWARARLLWCAVAGAAK